MVKAKVRKQVSRRARGITVYFSSVEEKAAFDALAAKFGITSSVLGRLAIGSGLAEVETGFTRLSKKVDLKPTIKKVV